MCLFKENLPAPHPTSSAHLSAHLSGISAWKTDAVVVLVNGYDLSRVYPAAHPMTQVGMVSATLTQRVENFADSEIRFKARSLAYTVVNSTPPSYRNLVIKSVISLA